MTPHPYQLRIACAAEGPWSCRCAWLSKNRLVDTMKRLIIFWGVVGILCICAAAEAQTKIRAEGMALISNNRTDIARDKALDAALRSAVEKVVGIMISSTTEVENFQVKMDRILSESKGFINTYKILSEKRQDDQFVVVIEADVVRERLKDRLEAIDLIMARKAKPRIMLLFTEQAPKDAIAEAAMSRYFMGKGFKLVDGQLIRKERSANLALDPKSVSRMAGQFGAEIVMIGGVEAATSSFNVGGIEMHSNKVTVSVKVINGDTGEVVTTDSKGGSAPGMKGDIKKITEEAAEKLARQMMEEVLEKWSQELVNTVTVKLIVSGLDSYEELQQLKDLLATDVKGFKELHQRAYQRGEAELDVEMRGNSQSLADDLALMSLKQRKVKILGITANRVEAGFTP
jgi:hypothetical protein